MKQKSICTLTGALLCVGFSMTAMAANKSAKMTCEDFIALDEVARPKIVYWFDGFDRKGKPEETIDFDQDERLVPVLVQECMKNPKHLLAKKVKDIQKKTASN